MKLLLTVLLALVCSSVHAQQTPLVIDQNGNLTVMGTITRPTPNRPGSMLQVLSSGQVSLTTNTYEDQSTGSLVAVNATILGGTVSGTNLNTVAQISAGVAPVTCTLANNGQQVITLGRRVCTCTNGVLTTTALPITLLGGAIAVTATCPL